WGEENEEVRRRLLREARACGRLNHRNVVEIYDVGQTDEGEPFLVMQLLSGETLAELMKRERKLTQSFAAFIALEVTRALTAAHAAGIIHRDLKPPNVYLHKEPDGEGLTVKVLDFGVSKILASHDGSKTETGSAIGSPAYMSPEQAKGDRYVDHRTDIWALGVLLFEMLTGRRPFLGETMFTVVADILGGPIPLVSDVAPEVDPGLVQIVARCIERDVRKRVASAEELVALLRPFVAGRSSPLDSSPFSRAFATGSYPNAEKVLAAGHASDPSLQPGSGPRSAVPQSAPGGQRRPTFQPVHQPPPPPPQQAGPAYPQNSPQGATPHAPAQAAYAQSTPQALPQPQPQRPQQSGHGQPVAYPASPRPQQPSAVQKAPAAGPGPLRTTLRMDHALQPTEPVKRSAMPSVSDAPTAPGQQLPKNQVAPISTPAPPPVHAPEPPPPPQSAIASAPPSSATTSPVAEGEATGKPQLLEEDDSEISNALTSVRMSRPEIPSQPGASLSKPPPAPPLSFGAPIDTLSSALASSAPISAPVPPPASTPPSGSALGSLSALANLSVDSS
ncbi:MAG: protein kinase, partial [Polyangiaceae bacterium]|nr:protein kinase [Polyangiaceae bacterium]